MPQNEDQDRPRSPGGSVPDTAADIHDLDFAEVGQQIDDRPQGGGLNSGEYLTEQGPAPADLAERPAPPVPTPSEHGLSAQEVARLTGEDGNGDGSSPDSALDASES